MAAQELLQLARLLAKYSYTQDMSHRKRDVVFEIMERCIQGAMAALLQTQHKDDIPF